jgi:GNAT superfamily N-acetyltransferase
MTARVIQGSFVGGGPRLPSSVIQPKAMPRLPGPPVPAFAGRPPVAQPRLPGPPAPAFAGRPPVAQRHGAVDPGQLGLASAGGRPLPEAVRGKMEAALGANFADVRVHVGPQAERIGAIAFTLGSDIYFAPGRFQPDTVQGQQLLGHELTHVVQQRAGRVRNPLGSGIAVVQDHALEAEADRLGRHAAAHRVAAQARMPPGAAQPSAPVRISPPISTGPGSYRLTAGAGGRQVGSVMVHSRDKGTVEVTDLGVDQTQRGHGIGQMLVASAAKTGLQFGKSKVTLAAQDKGSGHLTQWYKSMGFTKTGVNQRGFPQLEAPISRVLAGTAQRKVDSGGTSVLQRMESASDILFKLAKPQSLPPVDVNTQRDVAATINRLIEKHEIWDWDENKAPDVCCLGGIVLGRLNQSVDEMIGSADLIQITPAKGIDSYYNAIRKNEKLKKQIVSLMIRSADRAGQLKYLMMAAESLSFNWKVVIEVHYYYKRKSSQINFHKDTLGETSFVNLMYLNEDWIAGPEYVLNPPRIGAHDANTAKTLPTSFRQDLETVRGRLPKPTHVEATFVEPYGFIAFTDETIHHTTPHVGPRTVSPKDIELWFRTTILKLCGMESKQYTILNAMMTDPSKIALLPQGFRWRSLFRMATAPEAKRYTREDLQNAGVPAIAVEQLLDATHAYGYTTVSVPKAFNKLNPEGKGRWPIAEPNSTSPSLRRRMSVNTKLHEAFLSKAALEQVAADIPRCFFRVWIRFVPHYAQL